MLDLLAGAVAVVLSLAGIAGCFVPVVPGPALSYCALLLMLATSHAPSAAMLAGCGAAAAAVAPGSRVSDFRVEWRGDGIVLDFDLTVPLAQAAGREEISAALTRAMQGTPHNPKGLPVTLKIDFREAYV